jgi:hypothetical protein
MTSPSQPSPRVAALLKKTQATRGRLIFALDATASREPTWDLATQLQGSMYEEASRLRGLDVQLVYYRGLDEVQNTPWLSDAQELLSRMSAIRCETGATKIARILQHVRTEHTREKVSAAIFIGDAAEEPPSELYDAATDLGVPLFMFQEGDGLALYFVDEDGEPHPPLKVEQVFRELARITNGAYAKFDAGAVGKLRELLQAVAAFATGGVKALANQHTDSARKLLAQVK